MSHAIEPDDEPLDTPPSNTPVFGEAMRAQAEQHGQTGVNWFFWIAVLSLVNTAVAHFGGNMQFIIGLSVTVIADAFAIEFGKQQPQHASLAIGIAIGFSLLVALVVLGFGWLSRKRILWVFAIGIGLYLLDGVVYLLLGDIKSAGFHGFALFGMIRGWMAFRQLAQHPVDEVDEEDDDDDAEVADE